MKLNVNEDIISAVLNHYASYEVESHCKFVSENDQEIYTETTSKVLAESILDEDLAILELRIVAYMDNNTDKETANKTPNVVQRVQRKCEKKVTLRNLVRRKFRQKRETTRNYHSKTFLV